MQLISKLIRPRIVLCLRRDNEADVEQLPCGCGYGCSWSRTAPDRVPSIANPRDDSCHSISLPHDNPSPPTRSCLVLPNPLLHQASSSSVLTPN